MPLFDDYVRLDRASFMDISRAYFAARGGAAWSRGEVPSYATSSPPAAAKVARLVATFARGRPIRVLEIGGGSGQFARNFLDAYPDELIYVWSDFSEITVKEGLQGPLAEALRTGRIIPALFDAERPLTLAGVAGPVAADFDVVIANYVACVLPTRAFRRGKVWEEAQVRLSSVADGNLVDKAPTELGILDTVHIELLWEPSEDVPDAVVSADRSMVWPVGFFTALDGLRALVKPDGIAVISDFGAIDITPTLTPNDVLPRRFGNSIAFCVQFPSLALWASADGRAYAGSTDPTAAIHTAIVSFGASLPADLAAAVAAIDGLSPSQALLDYHVAADIFRDAKDYAHAARFYARCAQLDPRSVRFHLDAAGAYLDAGAPRQALVHLDVAAELQPDDAQVQFERARALAKPDGSAEPVAPDPSHH